MKICFLIVASMIILATPAVALDWTQPILDEQGSTVPDWPSCPGKEPAKDKCEVPLTIGALAARMLCSPDQIKQPTAEQKALECHLGLMILADKKMTPDAKQLAIVREAIGRHPSPLAVARAWDILDAAVK